MTSSPAGLHSVLSRSMSVHIKVVYTRSDPLLPQQQTTAYWLTHSRLTRSCLTRLQARREKGKKEKAKGMHKSATYACHAQCHAMQSMMSMQCNASSER